MSETLLSITVVHSLKGRLRCKLSHTPVNWRSMREAIVQHDGINEVTYTASTRSVLLSFNSSVITQEEFIIRLAIALSSENNMEPVRILAQPPRQDVSPFAFISGFLIGIAGLSRVIPGMQNMQNYAEWASGIGTAGAVIGHGYKEVRETGNFDPEVLSVVYLVYSLIRGNGITAAFITWIASFGRHILMPRSEGIFLKIRKVSGDETQNRSYDVEVKPDIKQQGLHSILKYMPAALVDAVAGGTIGQEKLVGQIKKITEEHNSILEGLGKIDTTINPE